MKNILLILFVLISGAVMAQQKTPVKKKEVPKKKAPSRYWQELSEKEKASVLADSAVPKNMMDLYNNKFTFYDAKENESLMKSLTSPGGGLVALRIYLFDKLVAASDTAITSLLNAYSSKMIYNQPDLMLRFFAQERIKKNEAYKKYAPFLAADLDEKVEYANFKSFLDLYFMNSSALNRQQLALLFKECEKAGAGSKNPVPIPLPPREKDE